MADAKKDKLQIRNSTVDFLVFTKDAHEDGIEVRVQDHDVWLTQKAIAQLFDVDRSVVTKHLKNVYESGELSEDATCANFAQVADNGKTYHYKFYSLPAIIAVGYRINSGRATQFRQWATKVLDTFTKQGYVLDKSRLINGQIFDEDYFDHLISEIQEIRASERRFYQKITDIYATAVDYSLDSQTTKDFFATVQNKMHYAVHGGTAAEVIMARADHTKEHMGLTSWKNAPDGKIVKADVSVAKNYLSMQFPSGIEIDRVDEEVGMDVLTVCVGADQNFVSLIVLGQLQCGRVSGDRVDCFAFREALYHVIEQYTVRLVVEPLGGHEIRVDRFRLTVDTCDQLLPLELGLFILHGIPHHGAHASGGLAPLVVCEADDSHSLPALSFKDHPNGTTEFRERPTYAFQIDHGHSSHVRQGDELVQISADGLQLLQHFFQAVDDHHLLSQAAGSDVVAHGHPGLLRQLLDGLPVCGRHAGAEFNIFFHVVSSKS